MKWMNKNIFIKRKKIWALFLLLFSLSLIIACLLFFFRDNKNNESIGTVTGKSALIAFQDIAGESRIDSLADLKVAKENISPVTYLIENSVYILDEIAIEVYVESHITAAESTAQATEVTVETLVVDKWGYDSIDAYRSEVKELTIAFIKERLAVYKAADEMKVKITQKEYEKKLGTYAFNFGYATPQEFTYACRPISIANEMLYDKTLDVLCS